MNCCLDVSVAPTFCVAMLFLLKGTHFTRGSRLVDFKVTLGDAECIPMSLVDNQVTCKPPWDKPTKYSNDTCSADAMTIRASSA